MARRSAIAAVFLLWLGVTPGAGAQWQADGNPVCAASLNQTLPAAVADGAGGAIIVWTDARNGSGGDLYAQRMDAQGHPLWAPDGVPICTAAADQSHASVVSDGAGGAIIAWDDFRNGATSNFDIYAQRVNASGAVQWTTNGVAMCTAAGGQYYPELCSNGSGGAIVVWDDYRNGSFNTDVFAARVTAAGATPDGALGIPISARASSEGTPALTPYAGGGAIIAWTDSRNGVPDIYAARLSGAGVVLDPTGIPICQIGGDQLHPAIVGDGAGGAIIAWPDIRVEAVYAQRIDAAGAVQWTPNGVPVSSPAGSGLFDLPRMLPDGAGGALVVWLRLTGSDYNIYAQRLNGAGARQWLPNEVPVCTDPFDQRVSSVVSDGAGGVIVLWEDRRNDVRYDIYAQRVLATGALSWTPNGIVVCQAEYDQHGPVAVSDAAGGALVAWQDSRQFFESDIYAGRVDANGQIPTGVESAPRAAFGFLPARPNPFTQTTEFSVRVTRPTEVSVRVFDAAGRRVRTLQLPRAQPGWQRIAFDGRDDAGRPLATGVYYCEIMASGGTATQKLVLVK